MAEALAKLLHGKVKIEDAGFDWKVRETNSDHTLLHVFVPFHPSVNHQHPRKSNPNPMEPHMQVLGPDVQEFDYVAWTADQDAFAYSGQKCSAQSILFAHENWVKAGIEGRLKARHDTLSFSPRHRGGGGTAS